MPPQPVLPEIRRPIKVSLKDLGLRETIPNRTILLLPPTYQVTIGRGSQAEHNLHPQEWNAWFGSRVMSREHAYLRADPATKQVFLEDAGSMHGTYVQDSRIEAERPQAITENDIVQLGTEIVRGDREFWDITSEPEGFTDTDTETYKPLVLSIRAEFFDKYDHPVSTARTDEELILSSVDQAQLRSPVASSHLPKNTFTIDYSEEEDEEDEEEDDDDIELVYESIRVPSSEIDRQSRTFSVPDSDLSESDVEPSASKESAPSSPEERTEKAPKPVPTSYSDTVVYEVPDRDTEPTAVLPGSSMQNALDVSDDEDQENVKDKENISEEVDAASIYSEEYHDSTDEDAESNMSEPDYESDADMYEDEDAQEEQSIDDLDHQESNNSHNQGHNEAVPRSPSPSDCALPKPSWYPPNNLPAIQNLVEHAPSQPILFPDTVYTIGPAQLSPFQPFGCFPSTNWASSDNSPGFAAPFDQTYNAPPLVPFPQSVPPAPRLCTRPLPGRIPQIVQPVESSSSPINEDGSIKSSKVSINDIIDDVNPNSTLPTTNRKRKADEISTATTTEENTEARELQPKPTEAPTSDASTEAISIPSTDSDTLRPASDTLSTSEAIPEKPSCSKKSVTFSPNPVVIDTDSERPRKKTKTQNENQSGTFLKYFAAAVGGATFGAVGTVFGLAALPSDYFL